MKKHNSKSKIEKKKKNQKSLFKKQNIFLFCLSFFIGFFGFYLLIKKGFLFKKNIIGKKDNQKLYSLSKTKEFLNFYLSLYYDPLDLVNDLKELNKILIVDIRDKNSFKKGHIKTAILFENIDQIKKLSLSGKKEIVLYGSYQGEKRIYQIANDLLNQGLKVKILSVGYNQFYHFKVFWLPQSQWEKINPDELTEIND